MLVWIRPASHTSRRVASHISLMSRFWATCRMQGTRIQLVNNMAIRMIKMRIIVIRKNIIVVIIITMLLSAVTVEKKNYLKNFIN